MTLYNVGQRVTIVDDMFDKYNGKTGTVARSWDEDRLAYVKIDGDDSNTTHDFYYSEITPLTKKPVNLKLAKNVGRGIIVILIAAAWVWIAGSFLSATDNDYDKAYNDGYVSGQADIAFDISNLGACPTEDSTNCYWDGGTNNKGQHFFNINGETYYLAGEN